MAEEIMPASDLVFPELEVVFVAVEEHGVGDVAIEEHGAGM